ncbi:MAG TPA: response regulator [Spirochaetota bacterium]|nr:response regulator [Spirochaetota bacterium]
MSAATIPRILFVDDEDSLRFLFCKVFEKKPWAIDTASDFSEALKALSEKNHDVVITDITMPGKSGLDLLRDIHGINRDILVILITGNPSVESASEAVRHGAYDYLIKPFNMTSLEYVIENALQQKKQQDEKKRLEIIEHNYIDNLERTLHAQTLEIRKAYKFLSHAHAKSLQILARAADYRDDDTGTHIAKIGEYSFILAKHLGLSAKDAEILRYAAPMHDVGKIGIPDSILQKPGSLTAEEFEIIKRHTIIGAQIFFDSVHPYHIASGIIALTHHERYNGTGYPRGISGDDIHLFGRIVAVADVFDALITPRVYKEQWPVEKAVALIRSESGKHFDPKVCACFLDMTEEILEAGRRIETEEEQRKSSFNLDSLLAKVPASDHIDEDDDSWNQ